MTITANDIHRLIVIAKRARDGEPDLFRQDLIGEIIKSLRIAAKWLVPVSQSFRKTVTAQRLEHAYDLIKILRR